MNSDTSEVELETFKPRNEMTFYNPRFHSIMTRFEYVDELIRRLRKVKVYHQGRFYIDTFRLHVTSWTHTDYTTAAQVFIFCRVSHSARRAAEMVSQSKSSADVVLMR